MWYKIAVYNFGKFLGSFYTNSNKDIDIKKDINLQYGEGKWNKYIIDN